MYDNNDANYYDIEFPGAHTQFITYIIVNYTGTYILLVIYHVFRDKKLNCTINNYPSKRQMKYIYRKLMIVLTRYRLERFFFFLIDFNFLRIIDKTDFSVVHLNAIGPGPRKTEEFSDGGKNS